jgi:hypothetical protein
LSGCDIRAVYTARLLFAIKDVVLEPIVSVSVRCCRWSPRFGALGKIEFIDDDDDDDDEDFDEAPKRQRRRDDRRQRQRRSDNDKQLAQRVEQQQQQLDGGGDDVGDTTQGSTYTITRSVAASIE